MQTTELWQRMQTAFHAAAALDGSARESVLAEQCAGDPELLQQVRDLLDAADAEEQHQAQSSSTVAPLQDRLGPYVLDRLLGRGGMGAVYLARRVDGEFNQQVAIKIIDLPLATELFQQRFRAERQILAGMSHPYIARLLDGGVSHTGVLYIVMEYVDGMSITRFCTDHALGHRERVQLFRKVCEAVQYAHSNLVVHRDLKPDNILVDAEGNPRLLDFGTAKLLQSDLTLMEADLTRPGTQTFTPAYASPEQVLGEGITTASDVYTLGVLLYVLLTGTHPYHLESFTTGEMLRVICQDPPTRPTVEGRSLDADLEAIVMMALRKDPRERYPSVEQLSADLQAYLEGRPVAPRRGDTRYRIGKFIGRNRLPLGAAVVVVLLLLAGLGAVLWQAHVANVERRRAEARSADLRELSTSLLSELDEALQKIPGSTGAQQILVSRVLVHLDRMARDAGTDRQAQLDVIDAYTRLGNVQGNLYYQNVADTAGALGSFDRALALAVPLAKAWPRDRDVLRAAASVEEARGETLSDLHDAEASVKSLRQAVATFDAMIQLPGTTAPDIFQAGIAYETLGNELAEDSGLSDAAAGVAAYRRALAMNEEALQKKPDYMAVRRGNALMHVHLGNAVLDTAPATALAEFEDGLKLQAALPEAQRALRQQVRLHALMLRKEGAAYAESGNYAAALPLMDQGQQIYQGMVNADADDVGALRDMQRMLDDRATMEEYALDPELEPRAAVRAPHREPARAALQAERRVLQQIAVKAPNNEGTKEQAASVLLRLAAVEHTMHLPVQAAAVNDALRLLREAAMGEKRTAHDVDLYVNGALHAAAALGIDPKPAVAAAEHGVRLTYGRSPSYYLLLARVYRAAGDRARAATAAQSGLLLLGAAQEPFRLRTLLQSAATQ